MGIVTRISTAAVAAASLLVMAGCATGQSAGGSALATAQVAPPSGEVVGTGMLLDVAGDATLCLGPVAESFPPQCDGLTLVDWSWDGVDGYEESGETRWGTYAVFGTFDGDVFTVTQPPIMLALYDPMRPEHPTGGVPGETPAAELDEIATELPAALGDLLLATWTQDGYLWADVVWDDGTLQAAADTDYGDGVVIIRSALRPIG
ncbi:hypothetical protein IT882_08310 [Microbacterium schleiferi]|uniref:Uncharacterized protein n=1 Tax=Microbacterium schleiferi TaxID=69362 RepID=A0A7S8MVE8_9MICO|nr:hypothetical protein [Microbacterium schleiferi]QPE03403.1 hypothetical protein IT882_08310 [Microbacterium schleiferi]